MHSHRWIVGVLLAIGLGGLGAGCSSSSDESPSGTGGSATGGSGGSHGLDAATIDVTTKSDAPYDGPTCAAETHLGETYPLDMYVMMDQSGSMVSTIDAQKTVSKWKAVTTGLGTFFQTEASAQASIGVGIQFFPLPVVSSLTPCQQGIQCAGGDACLHTGDQWVCVKPCSTSAECGPTECVAAGVNICANDSCAPADYANPEVAIGPIASTKDAVLAAMNAHLPMMYTPTGPAMLGAIQYAKGYAPSHPDRKVIVVLATDGEPTECPATMTSAQLVQQVQQAAADGVAGSPSIQTFVIGVVKTSDTEAVANLNAIAASGGTTQAMIVQPNQDLATQFGDALVKIAGDALACEYKIPQGDGGKTDLGKVNVVYAIDAGTNQTAYHVADASKCDSTLGGWYYDAAQDPKSIKLCPATCAQLHKVGQKVELGIEVGCQTQNMPPK